VNVFVRSFVIFLSSVRYGRLRRAYVRDGVKHADDSVRPIVNSFCFLIFYRISTNRVEKIDREAGAFSKSRGFISPPTPSASRSQSSSSFSSGVWRVRCDYYFKYFARYDCTWAHGHEHNTRSARGIRWPIAVTETAVTRGRVQCFFDVTPSYIIPHAVGRFSRVEVFSANIVFMKTNLVSRW